jgi:hypothetical protein
MEALTKMLGEREWWAATDTSTGPRLVQICLAYVAPDAYRELERIWNGEFAMQDMGAMLSALQLEHQVTIACPYCSARLPVGL